MDIATTTYKVAFGPIMESKLPPGDPRWPAFNASFVNKELPQVEIASYLYDGQPITTWHRNRWRAARNYELGQHLGVDFDTGDERSAMGRLLKDSFIRKKSAIVYSTPSHTPDAPRARVIFLLDKPIYQAKNYALASAALLWIFGSADRQCKDACRFYYGGRPGACEMEWLGNELPLAEVQDLIGRYQQTGLRQRRQVSERYAGQTADEARVVGALGHIDAWQIDYDQWVDVLMAIHSEFPGDTGLRIAESWADGKLGEVAHKWRSFDQNGNVSGRVGIGTLFVIAKEHGWQVTPSG